MKNTTVYRLVHSFSQAEIREFRKFLVSPVFNQRDDMLELFDRLLAIGEDGDKRSVWRSLHGKLPYSDQKMRLLMSYLHRLLEQYLVWKERSMEEIENRISLAIAYRRRGMQDAFTRVQRNIEKSLEEQPLRDMQYYERQFRVGWEVFQFAFQNDPTDVGLLRQLTHTADLVYLTQQLRLVCLLTAHSQVYSAPQQEAWAERVLSMAEKYKLEEHPALVVYLQCYKMLRYPEAEIHFQEFKNALLKLADFFPEEEQHSLYIWAINYCVRRINSAEGRYFGEALDLYKAGLEKGFIFGNGELSRFTYHNIVAAGLHIDDLEWVRFFINEYKNRLAKKYRESSFSFNLARLEFANRNYHFVMELLQKANYRDPLLNLAAKMLLVKTFYETGETELIPSHLDAMRNYIHRKRVIGYHRSNYLRTIRYFERILNINPMDHRAVKMLRDDLQSEAGLSEKDFLQKMLLVFQ